MAEAITRGLRPEIEVLSCGLKTIPNYPATNDAKTVVAEKGWNLENHISKNDSSSILKDSLILCMTENHRSILKKRYPSLNPFLLSEIGTGTPEEILDPIGKGISEYRRTLNSLINQIEIILVKW